MSLTDNHLEGVENVSPPLTPAPSAYLTELGVETLNKADRWSDLRNKLRDLGKGINEWAGVPIPLEDERLILNPKYPLAHIFKRKTEDEEPKDYKVRNIFYSHRRRCDIVVFEEADGRITWGPIPAFNSLNQSLHTMGNSVVWGLEQEHRALLLLGQHVNHYQFKMYALTGMFLEKSPRSGVLYAFRRLRPTIAFTDKADGDKAKILCALCLHPLGYYEGSWAGALCPTDDVVAHLMLMRGDEKMFWRSCNQHAPHRPEAGL